MTRAVFKKIVLLQPAAITFGVQLEGKKFSKLTNSKENVNKPPPPPVDYSGCIHADFQDQRDARSFAIVTGIWWEDIEKAEMSHVMNKNRPRGILSKHKHIYRTKEQN